VDAEGTRYLAVHLGGASHAFMPDLVQFLSFFGPGEFRSVWPRRRARYEGNVEILDRLTIGNLIVARRRWSCQLVDLLALLDRSDPAALVALTRWRARHGIPERVFVSERIRHVVLADRYKPQFLDLTSARFVPVLRAAIESSDGTVRFEEMLPCPTAFPHDTEERPWAVELMLDSVAFPWRSHTDSELASGRVRTSRHAHSAARQQEPSPAHY
jgi:hypothetical protein